MRARAPRLVNVRGNTDPAPRPAVGRNTKSARDGELLTPREVAALFHVHPKTVTRWAKAGKIGFVTTVGGHRRYHCTEIHAVLDALTSTPPENSSTSETARRI